MAEPLTQAEFLDNNPRWVVKPFALDQVSLLDGTLFTEKRDRILTYAAAYSADRVLHNFRVTAGLPTPPGSAPPGGWDDATGNLRGHFSGHLITLFAQAYASTRSAAYQEKVGYIVAELGKCQDALAASGLYSHPGFLAAYPETQFVRLESFATYPTIWAPYYTCHKIMRGLLDAYLLAGNQQALDIVTKMGDWVHSRLSVLPRETLNRMWAIYIAGEFGAMNEVMADLYAITGEQRYLDTAKCFDNRQSLFGACVEDRDILTRDTDSTTSPSVTYFLPLTPGSVRGFGNTGTCCGGTGLENHTKYQESIYFRSADDSALYVNPYVASVLQWTAKGITVTQATDFPRQQESTLTITGDGQLDINLRIPAWAAGFRVRINGVERKGPMAPGTYLRLRRTWHTGDTIGVSLPFQLRVEKALDRPDVQSVFNGPVLLPAVSAETTLRDISLYKDVKLDGGLAHAITSAGGGTFTTNGHTLRPLYVGDTQPQHIYVHRHEPTVVFGSHDSGVANRDLGDGTTFLDVIWAKAPFDSHARFLKAVTSTSANWVGRGLFTREERASIVAAATAAEGEL